MDRLEQVGLPVSVEASLRDCGSCRYRIFPSQYTDKPVLTNVFPQNSIPAAMKIAQLLFAVVSSTSVV